MKSVKIAMRKEVNQMKALKIAMRIVGIVLLLFDVLVIILNICHRDFLSPYDNVFYSLYWYAWYVVPLILGIILLIFGMKKGKK